MMFDYLRKLRDTKKFYPGRILDIGAYNGVWTREVKGIWPIARYTCIEAGPKHRRTLKFLTKDFHIAVLGDKNRNVKMHLRKIQNKFQEKIAYTKGSTLFSVFPDFEERQMQTLASVVGEDARYDVIKQDVQGAEIMVMDGSPEIFKRATYVIQEVNIHPHDEFKDMPHEKQMDEYMSKLGFTDSRCIAEHDNSDQIDKIYGKDGTLC